MRMADRFIDLIAYVAYFLKNVNLRQPTYDQVRSDIQRIISEIDASPKEGAFSIEDYDMARFAIFVWIDEAILNSAWREKERWQGQQLQRLYYHTADGGEIFFERLNGLGPHQMDVREVYYLCLSMGFQGRYCRDGDDFLLDQLKTSNLKLLTGSSMGLPSLEKRELFHEAYAVETAEAFSHNKPLRLSPFTLFCIFSPILLFWVLFFFYRFFLDNYAKALIG